MSLLQGYIQGLQTRQALDKEAYAQGRAKIEDGRKDTAYNALHDKYGDVAGDPVTYGQLAGIQRAEDQAPADLRRANAAAAGAEAQNSDADMKRVLTASGMLLNGAVIAKQQNPNASFKDIITSANPALLKAANLTPEQAAQLADTYDKDPNLAVAHLAQLSGSAPAAPGLEDVQMGGQSAYITRDSYGTPTQVQGIAPRPKEFNPNAGGGFTLGGVIRYGPNGQVIADARDAVADFRGDVAQKSATGKEYGKVLAADLPLTKTQARDASAAFRTAAIKQETLNDTIDDALAAVDWTSAGLAGQFKAAGGPPANLKSYLTTIGANVGLAELTQLKKSGVTLGQVTEAEHALLQSLIANLDQIQDPAQLKRQLEKIRETTNRYQAGLQADYEGLVRDRGGAATQQLTAPATDTGSTSPPGSTFTPTVSAQYFQK